ncbi:hypothetical protein [Lysobacter sp. GCM10012299]|uniref:hypothetical protein n=1 Tax=Lysobacter sp. GCM10012299 TaxID=3317333 RepID=UPI003605B096
MPANASSPPSWRRKPARRRIATAMATATVAIIVILTAYSHMWALARGMPDVASIATAIGCLALTGLTLLAASLRLWAWTYALASLLLALVLLFSFTALFY